LISVSEDFGIFFVGIRPLPPAPLSALPAAPHDCDHDGEHNNHEDHGDADIQKHFFTVIARAGNRQEHAVDKGIGHWAALGYAKPNASASTA
jgi:hypothetical protein